MFCAMKNFRFALLVFASIALFGLQICNATDAYKRLSKEYLLIKKNPPPFIVAKPSESNILEWHYVITGPPGTPYAQGQYHGKLFFPSSYPFRPPGIEMITPNGRFETNTRLCLSVSDFHPESWNPAWSVSSVLTGLLSFMLESDATYGSIVTSAANKRYLAKNSRTFNLQNPVFNQTFPELCESPVAVIEPKKAINKSEGIIEEPRNVGNDNGKTFKIGGNNTEEPRNATGRKPKTLAQRLFSYLTQRKESHK